MNGDTVRTRLLPAVVLLAAALLLSGHAAAGGAGDKKSPLYKTPQDVFNAAMEAGKKKDMKTFCQVLTPDVQDAMAGGIAFGALFFKGFALAFAPDNEKEKIKAKFKPLDDALTKHGLTEAALKAMEAEGKKLFGEKIDINKATDEQKLKMLKLLVRPVKDKCALFMDLTAAMDKVSTGKKEEKKGGGIIGTGELKDLKVEGDKAQARIVGTEGGKEVSQPIEFRRIDGSWRIDLPLKSLLNPKEKGAPPPPPPAK